MLVYHPHQKYAWLQSLMFFAIVFLSFGAQAVEPVGLVKLTTGIPTVHRDDKDLPLKPGDDVFQHDRLMTGSADALGITLRDDTTLSMGPDARLELDEMIFNPAEDKLNLKLNLAKGTFSLFTGMIAKLAPERTNIYTPVASIGIRGTKFLVEVKGE